MEPGSLLAEITHRPPENFAKFPVSDEYLDGHLAASRRTLPPPRCHQGVHQRLRAEEGPH